MKIYHNPRCGKSRAALSFLRENGFEPEVIEYLKNPPSVSELKAILKLGSLKATDLIRTKEDIFVNNYKGKILSDDQWVEIMVANPILIERPVIVYGDKMIIGRTEEQLMRLIYK